MVKAYRLQSGSTGILHRTQSYLTRDDHAVYLAISMISTNTNVDDLPELDRKQVLSAVHSALSDWGTRGPEYTDLDQYFGSHGADKIQAWAAATVDRTLGRTFEAAV